jgi:hypothetical protein
MLLLGERPEYVDQLSERLRKLSQRLFEDLPHGKAVTLSATDDLYALESSENLYLVVNGSASGHSENRLCVYYEPYDLIGLTQCYQLKSLRISIDDNTEVIQHNADTLLRYVNETKQRQAIWNSYLLTLISLFQDGFARNHVQISQPHTGFMSFTEGQTIISQGDDAHEVFTILNGAADVFVDGTKVGEIQSDEIFGAMAVFTGDKRSATVIAQKNCTVLAVPREDFISLIQSHPQTTMTLIDNMARRIGKLNNLLADQEK